MKKPQYWIYTLIFIFSGLLKAEDIIYFHPKSDELSEFVIENTSSEFQDFWVLVYENEFVDEHHFSISGRTKMKVQLKNIKQPHQDFNVLIKNTKIKLSQDFQKESSTLFEKNVNSQKNLLLSVINLWVAEQIIKIDFLDQKNHLISSTDHKTNSYMKSNFIQLDVPAGASKVLIQAPQKIAFSPDSQMRALVDSSRTPDNANEDVIHFLVENGTGSSFVAPIKNPELINKAREEITNFQGYMIFADIDFNESDINRNHLTPLKQYWSWKITEVTALAQIGADWCQAYPEMIERMLYQLINQKRVCFRGQRIIRELKPNEL